jgi:hypothetical protein
MNSNNLSTEQIKAITEIVKGVFSEQVTKATTEAPTDNFIVYAFLVIAIVLIIAVVVLLKISSSATGKAVSASIDPYVIQLKSLEKSFVSSQNVYEKMTNKFTTLTEELVRFQTLRIGEEDKLEEIGRQFKDMQNKSLDVINNLFNTFREHEKNSYERQIEAQKNSHNIKIALVEMRVNCIASYRRKLGDKLIDKGYISRTQLEEVLHEQINELAQED